MDAYGKIWNERRMMIRERVLEEVPPGAELADETLQAMIDRTITELFPDEYIRLEEKRKLQTDAGGHAILRALPDGSFKDTEF